MGKDSVEITGKPVEIKSENVQKNSDGFCWREWQVRLPADAVADDHKNPAIWRGVQRGRFPFRRHDRVYCIAYDESWVAEAIVADADQNQVVLAKPRLTLFPARFDKLFQDDLYRVVWMGSGYIVERKSDGRRMTQTAPTAQIAERDLIALHPKSVAA
jgi:hypothetical protein